MSYFHRFAVILITLTCCTITIAQAQEELTSVLGLTREQPDKDSRFVDLGDGRLMVPYTATIPGTEIEFSMVPIQGGEFLMGNAENEDTSPQFRVRVEPFWMSAYEVTWGEYHRYMEFGSTDGMKAIQEHGVRVVTDDNKIDAVTCPSPLYQPDVTYAVVVKTTSAQPPSLSLGRSNTQNG